MGSTDRFDYIDLLRAFSIIGVMMIHVLSFHLSSPVALFFWNSLQFVVAGFVLCSGVVHAHYKDFLLSISSIIFWYKKRIGRILVPFYVYFVIHFLLFLLFPLVFNHFGMQKSLGFVIGSFFLYGGINSDWLPLLFLELTLLTPVFFLFYRKRLLGWLLLLLLFITTLGTISFFPYGMYKVLMWVGWSIVFLLGLFIESKTLKKLFIPLVFAAGGVFVFLFFIWNLIGHSLNFTDNKYPPNLYYLSFAICGTMLFFFLAKKIVRYVPQWVYMYISQKSYSLFFIHFIILDMLISVQSKWSLSIPLEIMLVISMSIGVSCILDVILNVQKAVRQHMQQRQAQ